MPYPVVSHVSARRWFKRWLDSGKPDAPPDPPDAGTSDQGDRLDWPDRMIRLTDSLGTLYDSVEGIRSVSEADVLTSKKFEERLDTAAKQLSNERFEAVSSVAVHKTLQHDPALANPEFWYWIATGPGLGLVRRRYSDKGDARIPDARNFTSPKAQETFFYRLWMRAELAYDPKLDDPYELVRCGDVDFWRSHVLRQMSMESRQLLAAFIRFQYPDGADGEKRLEQSEIRELIKHVRRAAANVLVEMPSEQESERFVSNLWQKIQASK